MELHLYTPFSPRAVKKDSITLHSVNITCQARTFADSSNITSVAHSWIVVFSYVYVQLSSQSANLQVSPLNAELNPIFHLLTLLGVHHILQVSRIRVNHVLWATQRRSSRLRQKFDFYIPICTALYGIS